MKVLELFAGTRSIGKAFEAKGHEVFSVEWNKDFENINLYADISTVSADDILQKFGRPDVIWASPDCTTFSVAAISRHRRRNPETGNLDPISDYAEFCDEVDKHVLQLIKELNPTFYFIENPRGGMRKMTWMQNLPRYTVTYYKYGEKRMKPTDIWTNHPDPQFIAPCKNGDLCHEAAPRGSKTGTQGLKGSKERSIIPEALCKHIVCICEKYIKERGKEMELKIYNPTEDGFIKTIEWNYEEIKRQVADTVEMYTDLVYTDEQIKEAKDDRAALNRFIKALEDKRKEIKNQCLAPYESFEKQMKEIIALVKEPVALIDSQVKGYEEKKKQEKMDQVTSAWCGLTKPEGLTLEKIFDSRWLNASYSINKATDEMIAKIDKFKAEMDVLADLPEFSFEAQQVYISSLDLPKALSEAHRLADVAKKKAEHEAELFRQKAAEEMAKHMTPPETYEEEQVPGQMNMFDSEDYEPTENFIPTFAKEPEKEWAVVRVKISPDDKAAIEQYLATNNIEYKFM